MRFRFNSIDRAKRLAKTLRALLSGAGMDLPLGRCQDILADMLGYRDWHELAGDTGLPDAFDEEVSAGIAEARMQRQRDALTGLGISREKADGIVSSLRPSGKPDRKAAIPLAEPVQGGRKPMKNLSGKIRELRASLGITDQPLIYPTPAAVLVPKRIGPKIRQLRRDLEAARRPSGDPSA